MHVALVHIIHAASGGVEAYLTNLARYLANNGHQVTIICRTHAEPPHPAVRFVRLRPFNVGGASKMWAFARAVEHHVANTPYDVVYGLGKTWSQDLIRMGGGCHQTYLDLVGAAEQTWWRTVSGGWLKNRAALAIEARAFAPGAYRRVITNAHLVKRDVCARYGVPPDAVTVIHNGVDSQRFHPRLRSESGAALRARCGWSEQHHVWLFLGSGYTRKGLDFVLDAFPAVVARQPQARLLVVGYDSALAVYEEHARRLGIAAQVAFLGGQRDVPACYAAADAYVLPTRYDPFANSTVEALATGLPVITSDTNGGSEVMTPHVNGEILPYADMATLLPDAMVRWSERDRCHAARSAARQAAEAQPLADKMTAITDILLALAAEKKATR